jgi:hypothetical protein
MSTPPDPDRPRPDKGKGKEIDIPSPISETPELSLTRRMLNLVAQTESDSNQSSPTRTLYAELEPTPIRIFFFRFTTHPLLRFRRMLLRPILIDWPMSVEINLMLISKS